MDSVEDIYSDDYEDYEVMDSDGDMITMDSKNDSDADDQFMVVVDDSDLNSEPKNYTILKEEDIHKRLEDDILSVSSVLSVSRDAACILLRRYKWSVNNVHEAWFADEDGVRESVGLLKEPVIQYSKNSKKKVTCGICFDTYRLSRIQTCSCAHPFCTNCWKSYITTAINDGHGCLLLRCPDPSCNVAVLEDLIHKLVSDEEKKRYDDYIFRSYIESNRKTKWCPAPGCECAVEYVIGSDSFDVFCLCSNSFCWNCTEEAHSPADCETVAKWVLKNSDESENGTWIMANSKPCPQCKKPIEKNHGCMHMTCPPPCKFQFCWLCLGSWKDHVNHYSCNQYRSAKSKGEYKEVDTKIAMAKKAIKRYTHYYERWASNNKSREKALADLKDMKSVHLQKLSEELSRPVTELNFITEAWVQIVECRRVLKWTYAYGYYLPECEKGKKQFFEYLQGEAESALERLHRCAERELEISIKDDDLINFRTELTNLTRVTKKFFENLVNALENGLSDVGSSSAVGSKSRKRKASGNKKVKVKVSSSRSRMDNNGDDDNIIHYWTCSKCTYFNNQFVTTCQMCSTRANEFA